MNHGFVKVASAVPQVQVANCLYNAEQIESLLIQAEGKGVEIICFPELCITSYSCSDLFQQQLLLDEAEMALIHLMNFSRSLNIICIVGLPVPYMGSLLNCAAVLQHGRILGLVPKAFHSNTGENSEKRWFTCYQGQAPGSVWICGKQVPLAAVTLFHTPTCTFGIEMGEEANAPIPPSAHLAMQGADIIFNLSADDSLVGKYTLRIQQLSYLSRKNIVGYVYSSCGYGESTQDVVYEGNAWIFEHGELLAYSPRHTTEPQLLVSEIDVEMLRAERRRTNLFADCAALQPQLPVMHVESDAQDAHELCLTRTIDAHPFLPANCNPAERCSEIFNIQAQGLMHRIEHTHARTAIVGISGGLDSTLALLVCVRTFDLMGRNRSDVIGITMPGFGTTGRTYTNALNLMQRLGITVREISIRKACEQHFQDIGHDEQVHDATYENAQARERTQILMDIANQENGLVVGTGDLSELALGWATYNGDHMSMYGVNASLPKTLVREVVTWVAKTMEDEMTRATLLDIVDTPISPELIPADENGNIKQKTEDLVGPYELHDFFLYYLLSRGFRPTKVYFLACKAFDGIFSEDIIRKWIQVFYKRFFQQQFKRSCSPDGPKVGSCSLSPRGDFRMPSDAISESWLKELEQGI